MIATESLPTNTRVSTETIATGDVVRRGYGTSTITDSMVTDVQRWSYNGYVNANLTFADGTTETMWSGTYWPAIRL